MFSKFKNFLKIFKCKFSHCLLIVFTGILVKITVFLPHTVHVNSFFGSQVVSENLKGAQVITNIMRSQILPDIGRISLAGVDVGLQNIELIGKSISEFGSGFIEVLSPISAYGEAMAYEEAEQQGCKRECRTGENVNYDRSQYYASCILWFIIGYLSALDIQILWIYFSRT